MKQVTVIKSFKDFYESKINESLDQFLELKNNIKEFLVKWPNLKYNFREYNNELRIVFPYKYVPTSEEDWSDEAIQYHRLQNTIKQLSSKYNGKIRINTENYPVVYFKF